MDLFWIHWYNDDWNTDHRRWLKRSLLTRGESVKKPPSSTFVVYFQKKSFSRLAMGACKIKNKNHIKLSFIKKLWNEGCKKGWKRLKKSSSARFQVLQAPESWSKYTTRISFFVVGIDSIVPKKISSATHVWSDKSIWDQPQWLSSHERKQQVRVLDYFKVNITSVWCPITAYNQMLAN